MNSHLSAAVHTWKTHRIWATCLGDPGPLADDHGAPRDPPCGGLQVWPGNYPATAWVFCRFLNFASDFAPDQLSDSGVRETREFPEWSTKHPLFSLEINGNAKCWGPSVFLFVCRKTWYSYRPRCDRSSYKGSLFSRIRDSLTHYLTGPEIIETTP